MKNVAAEVIVIKDPFDEGTVQLSPNTGGQHFFRIAYMERQGTEGLGQDCLLYTSPPSPPPDRR